MSVPRFGCLLFDAVLVYGIGPNSADDMMPTAAVSHGLPRGWWGVERYRGGTFIPLVPGVVNTTLMADSAASD